jgi:putative spermidine/putrescine transport system ATP-binding protein
MTASTSQAISIQLRRCAKTFPDGTRVLDDVDLEILPGETLVLLGPSGCGKTTTLRLIAGLEQPDAGGQVLFNGQDVTALGIEKRNVGMVFQSYALFPNMTVAENVGYGLRIQKLPKRQQQRIQEMLEMMRLTQLANRSVDQLSGGQRQRVALARAIATRPRVLLLDEPLTALDAQLRDSLRMEINLLLRKLGVTAVYVTHDQAEAMALGDRIVVMSQGRVAQIGTPRDIYHRPENNFVANFIGTMNRVHGKVLNERFVCAAGTIAVNAPNQPSSELMFRPEDVTVHCERKDTGLEGTVAASFYLGDRTRLLVDIGQDQPMVVETGTRCVMQPGQRICLDLPPASAMLNSH